ncbi:uncharacterized protein LOC116250668 [Nymphaea colorata]|nr:uncharacterized protein LOC116250668 [Nymphaea colorata]
MMEEQPQQQRTLKETLDVALFLAGRIRKAVEEAGSFKQECYEVLRLVDSLADMLRSAAQLPPAAVYERPMRRIVMEVIKNLDRALALVRKCKGSFFLMRLITITNVADFRKVSTILENSNGDMEWLLDVCKVSSSSSGCGLSLPPIASTDPILSWVWSYIALVQNGCLDDRIDAANGLASLAADNARNGKIIIEEGGVAPLLKLLKDGGALPDAQLAAARAIASLATNPERVRQIAEERAVPTIVQCLYSSPVAVQVVVASLVAEMAAHESSTRDEFARENAIRPLVLVLSSGMEEDVSVSKPTNMHSLVQSSIRVSKEKGIAAGRRPYDGGKLANLEQEDPAVRAELMVNCSRAMWMLARGSDANSRRITETRGLMCLAKIIEKEQGEFQYNCLMAVSEIAAAAEANADLRRATFKTNSPAAKAVVDQLIRLTQDGSPLLQSPAMKSIGSLSRTFPARETRVRRPLVNNLSHKDTSVVAEAASALGKFANPENFLCVEHSKAIIEFGAVPLLGRLLKSGEKVQTAAVVLLCYLAIHVSNSEELKQADALGGLKSQSSHHPFHRELIHKAIYQLELYKGGNNNHIQTHDR